MLKINYLDIKHFKFFSDTERIELGEKNLLIFGENGSGKSTIYWALYTFLQSSIKSNSDIVKYFTQSTTSNINEKSLVNIYEPNDNNSYIKLTLNDGSNFLISKDTNSINTNNLSNTLIANANLASDFISYKYLFRFFNFLHRDDIDLFPLFSYEILQFLSRNTVNLSELWNDILTLIDSKPRKNDKVLNEKLTLFNSYLSEIISDLNIPIDNYLKEFKYKNLKLKLSVISGVYDGKELIFPKITLEITVKKSENDEIKIHRPQSYFNEAKLTAIAISVRLAITYNKLKDSQLKILVLDDLLVSLDMSNRETVLNVITNDEYLKDYQIIILTHEKSFFEIAKRKLANNWKYLEMYEDTSKSFPKPLILQSEGYFERAKKYFALCDYPTAGNYLRKASEEIIKSKLLDTFRPSDKDGLDKVIQNYEVMCKEFNIPISNYIERLKEFTKRVFNPSSHDDLKSPLYKKEIQDAIKVIEKLEELPVISKSETIIKKESLLTFKYKDKYEIIYTFLGNVSLYTFGEDIVNRDAILIYKFKHKLLTSNGVWEEKLNNRNKILDLKKIFCVIKHFINEEFSEQIDEDTFINNLKINNSLLSENLKKLVKKQIS